MKESISNAFIFGIFITFAFLLLFILSAAINYSRANKVKNKILNYVASYAELHTVVNPNGEPEYIDFNDENGALEEQINAELAKIGYRANYGGVNSNSCKSKEKVGADALLNPSSKYHYCIYAIKSERGYFYKVTTFMYFDIPIIGTTLEFPISGDTRVIYDLGTK